MNTDDNEKRLAQLAISIDTPEAKQAARIQEELRLFGKPLPSRQGAIYGSISAPAVKPVKGFDVSAHKAERAKAKRARKLTQRRQTVKG